MSNFNAYKCSCLEVLVRKRKKVFFFIMMGKLYMQCQYDPQKAQLDYNKLRPKFVANFINESLTIFARWSRNDSMTLVQTDFFFATNYNTRWQFSLRPHQIKDIVDGCTASKYCWTKYKYTHSGHGNCHPCSEANCHSNQHNKHLAYNIQTGQL